MVNQKQIVCRRNSCDRYEDAPSRNLRETARNGASPE